LQNSPLDPQEIDAVLKQLRDRDNGARRSVDMSQRVGGTDFIWNGEKAAANQRKHGVRFEDVLPRKLSMLNDTLKKRLLPERRVRKSPRRSEARECGLVREGDAGAIVGGYLPLIRNHFTKL